MQAPPWNGHPPERHALGGEPDAREVLSRRMWVAMLLALCLHGGLVLWAYLAPPVRMASKRQVIAMDVIRRQRPQQPTPPELPKPKVTPLPPQQKEQKPAGRSLAELLKPVPSTKKEEEPPATAVVVPVKPEEDKGPAKGPIDLFHFNPNGVGGPGGSGAVGEVPKGPSRLLKDERLEAKKEPDFVLVPEHGGGFRYDGSHFTAHIAPDGALSFDNKFPIGFEKGGTFSFDLTDLAMRSKHQDPYGAEKRRFIEYSEKLRQDLRKKQSQSGQDSALASLPAELDEIWSSGKAVGVRRRELYERWVDCADDQDAPGSTGMRARHIIEGYVRRHLPPGSPNAYTEEELRRFQNAREGKPSFDPYRGAAPAPSSPGE